MRQLLRSFNEGVRVMLRKAFSCSKSGIDIEDDSSDGDEPTVKQPASMSGFKFKNVQFLKVHIAELPVTVMNFGRRLILRLDAEGIVFLKTKLLEFIQRLADDEVHDIPEMEEFASFRFDDSATNVRDKVVWDPDANSWKLLLKAKAGSTTRASYQDHCGKTLKVLESLGGSELVATKVEACGRAVRAWNDLDGSKRRRITVPLAISLDSSPSAGDSQESLDGNKEESEV
jgi:hypothetical protein